MPSYFSEKAIRERLGELHDQKAALIALAEKENRDFTADEDKEYKSWEVESKTLEETNLPRALALKAEAEKLAQRRQGLVIPTPGAPVDETGTPRDLAEIRHKLPQGTYRPGSFRAFSGTRAEQEQQAYVAGRFYLATLFGHEPSQKWCGEHGVDIRNGINTGDNTSAGFLVPEQMDANLIRLVEQYGIFRQEARPFVMTTETATIPRRTSGVTVYFVGEEQEPTESKPKVDQVRLTARILAALIKWSREVSETAILSIADWVTLEAAYAMAVKEDACGFIGDGTSTYGGMVGVTNAVAAGSVYTALAGNTAFSTLDLVDFEGMVGKLPMYPGIRPKWYISQPGYWASMARLTDAAGGNMSANIAAGPQGMQFLGFPVVIVPTLNSTLTAQTSTTGLCLFGDLSMAATMGVLRGFSVDVSRERYFELGQIAIRATERFAINVHERGDASNAGPILALATPGS